MSVFLSNLDDYINPSQACINHFVLSKTNINDEKDKNNNDNNKKKKIVIETDNSDIGIGLTFSNDIKPNIIKTTNTSKSNNNIKVASISLNDCLACSGCVTSAEANLIADQGIDKFKQILITKKEVPVLMKPTIFLIISPQSRASLTHMFNLGLNNNDVKWTLTEVFLKISTLFKAMGVDYVLDGSSAGDIALIESREEFIHKWMKNYESNNNNEQRKVVWSKPPTSLSVSSTKKRVFNTSTTTIGASYFIDANEGTIIDNKTDYDTNMTPMLISHCPGWICYAEKTSPQSLPYISTSKSSQQITGVIIKKILNNTKNDIDNSPMYSNPYVVSIQPCYDKKLEGSRLDFFHDDINSQEIDLVLSTSEVWSLLEEEAGLEMQSKKVIMEIDNYETDVNAGNNDNTDMNISNVANYIRTLAPDAAEGRDFIESLFRCFSRDGLDLVLLSSSSGLKGGSGSYLEHIFRYASDKLLGISLWNQPLDYKMGRNTDIAEIEISGSLASANGSGNAINLKMGKAYGFRNIQSLMLKMKKGKCDLDLVEIMACPNGCNNGGGQLKVTVSDKESSAESNSRISAVEQLYATAVLSDPIESPLAKFLYSDTNLVHPYSILAREILHTQYHSVPKLEEISPLASKW